MPSLEMFSEIARVILVCLEAMNLFKVVQDAICVTFFNPLFDGFAD